MTAVTLPFTTLFYGQPFNAINVSSNGNLQFSSANPAFSNTCLPNAAFNNTIFAHWDDLWTAAAPGCTGYPGNNCGVYTSVAGIAPNRTFCIEWRTVYYNNRSQQAHFSVTLYEGQDKFDITFGQIAQGGSSATVGVQKLTGSPFSQFECNTPGSLTTGLQLTYNQGNQQLCGTPTPVTTRTSTRTSTRTPTNTPTRTPTPTFTPTTTCTATRYPITATQGGICPGNVDVGNHCDDCVTNIVLPFPVIFYGQTSTPFTSARVSSNGNLQFSSSNAAYVNTTLPAAGFQNTIFAHWDDLWTAAAPGCPTGGCGIFTRVSGTAPNRTFCIEWRAVYYNNLNQRANFSITLSEGQDTFRIAYATVQQCGVSATVGAQKDSTLYTQYSYNTCFIFLGLQLSSNVQVVQVPCPCYTYTVSQGAICQANTDSGNHCDDCVTNLTPPPFTMWFYGQAYNVVRASSNGNLQFGPLGPGTANAAYVNTCLPAPGFYDTLFAYWDDLRTDCTGCGIFTNVGGTAPNRTFCIQWISSYYNNPSQRANFSVTLFENQGAPPTYLWGTFNINYALIWAGGSATVGVQKGTGLGTGPQSSRYVQFSCNGPVNPGTQIHYTLVVCNPNPVPTAIPIGGISGTIFVQRLTTATPTPTPPCPPSGTPTPIATDPLPNARVQACASNTSPISCVSATTDASGNYAIAGLLGGPYDITVFPPATSADIIPSAPSAVTVTVGVTLTGQDYTLNRLMPPPPGTSVSPNYGNTGGVPIVNWTTPILLTTQGCAGGTATYQLFEGNTVIHSGSMTEGPGGTYTATIPQLFPNHGYTRVVITIICPCGGTITTIFDLYIDPSGTVRRAEDGSPIEGATVTLYRSDTADGDLQQVPDGDVIMSPENRTNPDATDDKGRFGWDVLSGYYVVRAEYPGCFDPNNPDQPYVETGVLEIPPPVTDLDLRLACSALPKPETTPIATATATATATITSTPKPAIGVVNGHLTWQGITQPGPRNTGLTAVLNICNGSVTNSYAITTDQNGNFSVATDLPNGSYNWQLKGLKSLATAGTVAGGNPIVISGGTATLEAGTQKAGDSNNDNVANVSDFTILKNTFGKAVGDAGYDDRADFNNDTTVGSSDFNLLKGNFGQPGLALTCP